MISRAGERARGANLLPAGGEAPARFAAPSGGIPPALRLLPCWTRPTPRPTSRRPIRGRNHGVDRTASPTARRGGPGIRSATNPSPAQQGDSSVRRADATVARPRQRGPRGERRRAQPNPQRHDGAPRSVPEAPLAGRGADLLPAPPALREALRGAGQARRPTWPSGCRPWAASPSPWRTTSPRRPASSGPRAAAKRCPSSSRGCSRRTSTSSSRARSAARKAVERGDEGTSNLLVTKVVRKNEKQAWFLSEHLVDTPLVRAK